MSGHLVLLDVGEHGLKRLHPRLKKDDSLSGLSETNAISLLDIYPWNASCFSDRFDMLHFLILNLLKNWVCSVLMDQPSCKAKLLQLSTQPKFDRTPCAMFQPVCSRSRGTSSRAGRRGARSGCAGWSSGGGSGTRSRTCSCRGRERDKKSLSIDCPGQCIFFQFCEITRDVLKPR